MSRIPEPFIDELLNRLDIVEIIDSRVKLRKTGKNYSACCPFHKEKTPSFTVSPDKQFYYCFGCGASGTALGFLMDYEHLNFIEAVERLAGSVGMTVPKEERRGPQKSHQTLYQMLERVKGYYSDQLAQHPQRQEAVTYLKNRGLSSAIVKQFGVGYAPPGWDNLLQKFGLNEEDRALLNDSGMTLINETSGKRYDRFRQRIMFPIVDVRGRTIGFGGRVLVNDKEPLAPNGKSRPAGPKYLNSPETPVFQKGRELYGLYNALQHNRKLEQLLVVEGYMDVIALAQHGLNNAVATLGTACTEEHLRLAFRYTSEVIFCFDGDNAGRKAARRALENALPAMADGRKIQFLFLPEGQDPDSLVRQVGAERFQQQMRSAVPLETFFFEAVAEGLDTRTMEGRARISRLAAPLLNRLPQGIFRELMYQQLAERTGLSLDVLQELMDEKVSLESAEPKEFTNAPPAASPSQQLPVGRAPLSQPKPQQQSASRTLFNPARLALNLLLEHPEIVSEAQPIDDLPDDASDNDLVQLKALLDYLRDRPRASFHSILGYWGGAYGVAAQQHLTRLVATQFLHSAKRTSHYDTARELRDALARIRRDHQLRQQAAELAGLASQSHLSDAQKQRMRELLQLKHLALRTPQSSH